MKRIQRHYATEQEILDRIEAETRKAFNYRLVVEECDAHSRALLHDAYNLIQKWSGKTGREADEKIRLGQTKERKGLALKAKAQRALEQADRIEQTRLPKLSEALAEFGTAQMVPVLQGDNHATCEI